MKTLQYLDLFEQIGLNKDQSTIYEILLKTGLMKAAEIVQASGIKKGLVYKNLQDLEAIGLVNKTQKDSSIFYYQAAHPTVLNNLLLKKEAQTKVTQNTLNNTMEKLASLYKLAIGKPNVFFYEGKEECIQLFKKSFGAKTEIYQIYDTVRLLELDENLLEQLTQKRINNKIKKRLLNPDSITARSIYKNLPKDITQVRYFTSTKKMPGMMLSFDDTLLLFTIDPNKVIGVEITDPLITQTFNIMYEALWQVAKF